MANTSVLPPIPWSHSVSEFGSVWVWDTAHFRVTVNGDARSCYYTIGDKVSVPEGGPRPFADGQAATFEEAERMIRGTIGKAYPAGLGYQYYAGPLATTFRLGTGQDVDLGVFAGQRVEVTVASSNGPDETYVGVANIDHYELVIATEAATVRISPSYILAITLVGKTVTAVAPLRVDRTFQGQAVPGCTGQPGFLSGTVEHRGLSCPIHEEHR